MTTPAFDCTRCNGSGCYECVPEPTPANECRHCKVAEAQGATHVHPANEWREEFDEKFGVFFNMTAEYHIDMDLAIKQYIQNLLTTRDSYWEKKIEEEISKVDVWTDGELDVKYEIKERLLDQQSAHLVERLEAKKATDENIEPRGGMCVEFADGYNEGLHQAIDIVRNK
jgi:hypothetical protein